MVLYLDNGENYILFEEVFRQLVVQNVDAGIIFFDKGKFSKSQLQHKYFVDCRLRITEEQEASVVKRIRELESQFDDFTFSKAIYIDRLLRTMDDIRAKKILLSIIHQLDAIYDSTGPNLVFGEITWSFEYISFYLCRRMQVDFVNPLVSGIFSSSNILLFDDKNSDHYLKKYGGIKLTPNEGRSANQEQVRSTLRRSFRGRLLRKRVVTYLRYLNSSDYRYSLRMKLKYTIPRSSHKFTIKLRDRMRRVHFDPEKEKFVMLTLHVQPEQTPDVVATDFSNQYELARQISNNLPVGFRLLIKEHPNAIGCRSLSTLRKYEKLPNAIVITSQFPMSRLMTNCSLLFSVAGTPAWEFASLGKPAFVFSNIYFNGHSMICKIKNYDQLQRNMKKVLVDEELPSSDSLADEKLLESIRASSFAISTYHPLLDDNTLSSSNVASFVELVINMTRSEFDS